jgi:hypothetical protein
MKTTFTGLLAIAIPLIAAQAQASQTRVTCETKIVDQKYQISFSVTGIENPATAKLVGEVGENEPTYTANASISIKTKKQNQWVDASDSAMSILEYGALSYDAQKKIMTLGMDDCDARAFLELSAASGFRKGKATLAGDDDSYTGAAKCTLAAE